MWRDGEIPGTCEPVSLAAGVITESTGIVDDDDPRPWAMA
jgi:hypothetical protein